MLVTVNEARVPVDYGSVTAAPYARQILEQVLPYLGIRRDAGRMEEEKTVTVPDVCGMSLKEARKVLSDSMLLCLEVGQGDRVTFQLPYAGQDVRAGDQVILYTYDVNAPQPKDMVCVPDVMGLSMVQASRTLRARGLEMALSGSGLAVRQMPAAGSYAPRDTEVEVVFEFPVIGEKENAVE